MFPLPWKVAIATANLSPLPKRLKSLGEKGLLFARSRAVQQLATQSNAWNIQVFASGSGSNHVAQIVNLLFRRLAVCSARFGSMPIGCFSALPNAIRRYSRVPLCATNVLRHPAHPGLVPWGRRD